MSQVQARSACWHLQVQALSARAVAMAALSAEATQAAPAAGLPKAQYDAITMLMHLGCM